MTLDLLIATRNPGKIAEFSALIAGLPLQLHTLVEFSNVPQVEESGSTYEENAMLKANAYARASGLWAIADDSGLEVDALEGAPGVRSARYAGPGASDAARTAFLLQQLERVKLEDWSARFCCCVAIADGAGEIVRVESARCDGRIVSPPRGISGFGYDPIFLPNGFNQTFAELSAEVKNRISHRAKAFGAARDFLQQFFEQP